jgi:hypothetical protein
MIVGDEADVGVGAYGWTVYRGVCVGSDVQTGESDWTSGTVSCSIRTDCRVSEDIVVAKFHPQRA